MKPIIKKYIGSIQACSKYLPFAVNKVVNVVDKERKNKAIASRGYSFSNGVLIKCTATKRSLSVLIQAALGGLIFIGRNDSDPTIRMFQSNGFTHNEYPNSFPTALDPYLAPFPTVPDNQGSPMPKYDWRNDTYTVFAGVGMRYAQPLYDKNSLDKFFGFIPSGETLPTICDKEGLVRAQGVTGSDSTGACIYENYCIGISIRGEIRAWVLDNPDTIITHQINLPSWVGEYVSLETFPGSGVYIEGWHGWLDGDSGIEWKFNKSGTKAVGLVYKIINYGTDGTGEFDSQANWWRATPYVITVSLNPFISDGGIISFSPSVNVSENSLGICAIDWYYLDDTDDTLSYSFLNYDENIQADRRNYRLILITNNLSNPIEVIRDAFNITVESYTEWDNTFIKWKTLYRGKVTGIDMRYHTYSYWGTSDNVNDISYAHGFDDNIYKDQIGTPNISDNYFDWSNGINRDWLGTADLVSYYGAKHKSVQYLVSAEGSSCAALENNKKRFAYMTETENNTGEFYDAIQRDAILTTHEDVFNSFGYSQDTDGDGQVNSVFHFLGVFT